MAKILLMYTVYICLIQLSFCPFLKSRFTTVRVGQQTELEFVSPAEYVYMATFWCFWLTIQNTTNRHVSNAFGLLAVFISFPLVRAAAAVAVAADFCCCCCAPTPPRPPFWGREVPIKKEILVLAWAWRWMSRCSVSIIEATSEWNRNRISWP